MKINTCQSVLLIMTMGISVGVMAATKTITDSQGRVLTTINDDGSTKKYVYGKHGEKSKSADENGKVTEHMAPNNGSNSTTSK